MQGLYELHTRLQQDYHVMLGPAHILTHLALHACRGMALWARAFWVNQQLNFAFQQQKAGLLSYRDGLQERAHEDSEILQLGLW